MKFSPYLLSRSTGWRGFEGDIGHLRGREVECDLLSPWLRPLLPGGDLHSGSYKSHLGVLPLGHETVTLVHHHPTPGEI